MGKSGLELLYSDSRGIYIPHAFCTYEGQPAYEHLARWGLTEENQKHWIDACNPDSEWYWDAWEYILNNAKFKHTNGYTYCLLQDGDLWAYCLELMTDEEKQNFGFDVEE